MIIEIIKNSGHEVRWGDGKEGRGRGRGKSHDSFNLVPSTTPPSPHKKKNSRNTNLVCHSTTSKLTQTVMSWTIIACGFKMPIQCYGKQWTFQHWTHLFF